MQTKNRRNLMINTTQIVVWAGVFLGPALVTGTITGSAQALAVFKASALVLLPTFILYCINYYFLVPKVLFREHSRWFYVINTVLIVGWMLWTFFREPVEFPPEVVDVFGEDGTWAFYVGAILGHLFIQCLVVLIACGLHRIMRANETMVAELTWLKHQLNPHFLFNTLNNISSLTQIDPDKAQESIGQLSDLLRYALYDSEAEKVPLVQEVEFMNNYIDLMALRCNELTTVTKELDQPKGSVEVAPLLFISLVENAFKHGVNARYPSFVHVIMRYDDGSLVFICENSVFEKQGSDHIGSGIGLENMKRRLELLYPGKYHYRQKTEEDKYIVEVVLNL